MQSILVSWVPPPATQMGGLVASAAESEKRPAGHPGGKPVLQRQTSRRGGRSDKMRFTLDLFAICFHICGSDKRFGQFETQDQDHLSGAAVSHISPDHI